MSYVESESVRTVASIAEVRHAVARWKAGGESVALVPTMGNLHAGHMSLVTAAQRRCDRVIVSLFVNPLQFGVGEDFADYPRTMSDDQALLAASNVDLLFAPLDREMCPHGHHQATRVSVAELESILCGQERAGHFTGVATIVVKLFNIVGPDVAVFGEKDYQQLAIIRRATSDLAINVDVVGAPTVREADGLAISSRNQYLTDAERAIAPALHAQLKRVAALLRNGERDFARIEQAAIAALNAKGFRTGYVSIRAAHELLADVETADELVILVAAHLGRARLIDNLRVKLSV